MNEIDTLPRPAVFCAELLHALEATDGRRAKRKRDTRPDAIGIAMKRDLLEAAVAADPEPAAFEPWLFQHCLAAGNDGGLRAMAISIRDEWLLAAAQPSFREWLEHGAPSDDRVKPGPGQE